MILVDEDDTIDLLATLIMVSPLSSYDENEKKNACLDIS